MQRFPGRAQKCWDQFDEYDSRGLHCVKQTSEKIKVHRLVKYKSKFLISDMSLRCGIRGQLSRRDCKTRAMRPRRLVGTCQEYLQAQKKEDKAAFCSLTEGALRRPHPQ